MDEKHERPLASIERRIASLKRAGAYDGFHLRAAISRNPAVGGDPPTRVSILASLRPGGPVEKPSYSLQPLVEPYLDLFTATFPGSIVLFLRSIIEKGSLEVPRRADFPALGHDTISFMDRDTPVEWRGPEFNGSEDSSWLFNEPWGGVSYLLDSKRPVSDYRIPRESLEGIGFYSLEQVLWHKILCPGGSTPERPSVPGSGIHVLLPSVSARLAEVLLLGQKVRVRVEAPETNPGALRLVLQSYGLSRRGRFESWDILPPRTWDPLPTLEVEHEYPSLVRTVKARLEWTGGEDPAVTFVDEMRGVRAETVVYPRLAVRQVYDPDLGSIMEAMGTRRQAHDLEWAVVSLLTLSGFQVDWLGYKARTKQTESEVDLVAYLPNEKRAIVGECTLRGADVGRKVSDLAGKGAELSKVLESWELRRILFTTISHAAVLPSDREGARELGVTILSKEGLAVLLRAVKSAVPPGNLWDNLRPDVGSDGTYDRLLE